MKKINILFIVIASIFVSCSEDKDDVSTTLPPDTSASIVGSWDSQPVTYNGPFSAVVIGNAVTGSVDGESSNESYIMTFSENPNLVSATGTFSFDLTATPTNPAGLPAYDFIVSDFGFPIDGSWSRSGNQLTIINGADTIVATILELTATTLKLSFSPEDFNIQDSLDNGVVSNVVLTNNIEISFIKVM